MSYDALAAVHRYIELERQLAVAGSAWCPDPAVGPPLVVTDADWHGSVVDGRRRRDAADGTRWDPALPLLANRPAEH